MAAVRTFPVPKALRASFGSDVTTLDEMEMIAATRKNDAGVWAAKVLARENDKLLDRILADQSVLPRGVVLADAYDHGQDIVTALVNQNGHIWAGKKWSKAPQTVKESVMLSEGDVAFVARALMEGADSVVLSSSFPLAFVSAGAPVTGDAVPADTTPPQGAVPVAIVDSIDKDAVLELLAVAPGPKVYRRHAGQWAEDHAWIDILKAVQPPPMVKLEEAQVASVAAQVDESTMDVPFAPMNVEDGGDYRPIRASSSYVRGLQDQVVESAINVNLALLAVAGRELSPRDYANTEKLRRYWLYGAGAAKIRWYTPGSWRRCYRNLVKYIGPKMTPGYCTNLSKRLGGPGVATHVGD